MPRFAFGLLICLGICSTILLADTPGEEAVKEAIKTLKAKRAEVKDKADQALLDTAIKDLEERLAQVGKGEPEPEAKKDGAFVLPKNWELKFNTGKAKPTYDQKTGVLKLAYDFSDAKQLKDFEFADDVKPTVQKGVLTVKGGDEIKHLVRFKTISVGVVIVLGGEEVPLKTSGDYWVFAGGRDQTVLDVGYGKSGDTFIAGKGLGRKVHGNGTSLTISEWFVSETKVGVKAGNIDVSGKKKSDSAPGHLILAAKSAPNQFQKLTVSGTLDPEWAKEFFTDK
jgi:hypothetical protein